MAGEGHSGQCSQDQAPLVEGLGRDYKGTLPQEMFAKGYTEALHCMVCDMVPLQPLRCPGSCGRIWCPVCAEKWLGQRQNKTCPTCRDGVAGVAALRPGWGHAYGQLVGMAEIFCPFTPAGCTTTGSFDAIMSHVDPSGGEGCGYRVVDCELRGCGERVKLKDIAAHMGECPHRQVVCVDCESRMPAHALEPHSNTDCLLKAVGCPLGCEGMEGLVRKDVGAHEATCPLVEVACPLCPTKVPRGQVERHLSTESASHLPPLLSLVDDLRGTVQVLREQEKVHRERAERDGARINSLEEALMSSVDGIRKEIREQAQKQKAREDKDGARIKHLEDKAKGIEELRGSVRELRQHTQEQRKRADRDGARINALEASAPARGEEREDPGPEQACADRQTPLRRQTPGVPSQAGPASLQPASSRPSVRASLTASTSFGNNTSAPRPCGRPKPTNNRSSYPPTPTEPVRTSNPVTQRAVPLAPMASTCTDDQTIEGLEEVLRTASFQGAGTPSPAALPYFTTLPSYQHVHVPYPSSYQHNGPVDIPYPVEREVPPRRSST